MHNFLKRLSRTRLSAVTRYGLAIIAIAAMTIVRLVAPLDVAPFLLYLPVVFLGALALGSGPGLLAVAVSDVLAAGFFLKDGYELRLSTPQVIAKAFDPFFTTKPIGMGTGLDQGPDLDSLTGAGWRTARGHTVKRAYRLAA